MRCSCCAGYALFGSETDGDVLKNLTAVAVQRYVPPAAAAAIVYGIAAAFTFNLLVNFVLKVRAVVWSACCLLRCNHPCRCSSHLNNLTVTGTNNVTSTSTPCSRLHRRCGRCAKTWWSLPWVSPCCA